MDDMDRAGDAVDARVVARDRHRAAVEIAGKHRPAQRLGCGNGEHAGSGTDVEGHGSPAGLATQAPTRPRASGGPGATDRGSGSPLPRGRTERGFGRPAVSLLDDAIEREQAAACGAVVAGAKGEPGIDLDGDAIDPRAFAGMRAMHDETSGLDRREAFAALVDPIGGRERLEPQRLGGRGAGRRCNQRAQGGFIRVLAEIDRQ